MPADLAPMACWRLPRLREPGTPHRPSDVLDLLVAEVLEGVIELVADVTIRLTQIPPGSASASRRAATFTPSPKMSCSSDNYVADVDPDAKPDPPLLGHLRLAIDHPTLDLDSA